MQNLDCRGLSCPQPVLEVRSILTKMTSGEVKVYVSTGAARDNIRFLAERMGWQVQIQEQEKDYILLLSKS